MYFTYLAIYIFLYFCIHYPHYALPEILFIFNKFFMPILLKQKSKKHSFQVILEGAEVGTQA